MQNDTYKTLDHPGEETLFKEKGSKFYGYAYPVKNEEEVKVILEELKSKHHSARHWCYAWQIGTENPGFRANDDGEPSNSAGMPIYGQIQSFELTNVLVVVVRYFGGTKLGVGGLIQAYKASAQFALEASTLVEKTIDQHFILEFEYKDMSHVMRVIKEKQLNLIEQEMGLTCKIEISVRKGLAEQVIPAFEPLYQVKVSPV
ncbi:YigZ family protein [Robertkochia marina]|uniref:YigZ family protein n=1 Tax=Robertkochia marina TaxID=1227945 RepID=A0A4S3M133_9FLAO|nr:YigZ family protein [Robertkochia marina]THD68061.1 YigZ family protein [Robertkochia marina]TRZ42654.1 YigZ family protein [Robertkochia marina]